MSKELELGKSSFEILSSDTKRNILKKLNKRKMTVTELSKRLDLSKSTIHEHLSKLNEHGFVEKVSEGDKKWVYYKLTGKSQNLLHNRVKDIVFLLSIGITTISGLHELSKYFSFGSHEMWGTTESMAKEIATKEVAGKIMKPQMQTHLFLSMVMFLAAIIILIYYWEKIK